MLDVSVPLKQLVNEQLVLNRPTSHPAARLPVSNPTKSFWINSAPDPNPLATEGSEGLLTKDADFCIIGSGITGVGAAYHLSHAIAKNRLGEAARPFRAVILEARDFCSAATGRNGGHLTPATYKHFHEFQEAYGTEQALRSLAIENYTVSSLLDIIKSENLAEAIDLASWGHIDLLVTDAEVENANVDLEGAKAAGVDVGGVEWLSKEAMDEKYGTPFPGFRFPGHNLWPLKLVTNLYRLAKAKSPFFLLSLHTRTPVTSISRLPLSSVPSKLSRRYSITTPRGSISCSYIIHATNAYASHLLPQFAGHDGIVPTRGQVMALRAGVNRDELGMSGWGNGGFEYWFPMPAKYDKDEKPLVILGGGREATAPQFELHEDDDSVINEHVSRLLKDYLPNLFEGRYERGREAEMEWTGIMGKTKLEDPFVGPVLDLNGDNDAFKGQFISAGYSGHGMPRAFSCAEVVADMIISELTDRKWSMPEWLPERYLTWNRVANARSSAEDERN